MNRPELSPGFRALLAGAVDYAGLFPPAALSLEHAVANYDEYRRSPDRWALGRFVVAAARLPALADVLVNPQLPGWDGTRISATAGASLAVDLEGVSDFNRRFQGRGIEVDAVEAKVASRDAIENLGVLLPNGVAGYGEVPLGRDQDALLGCLKGCGLRAKIRMGGVTRDLFPGVDSVAPFLRGVVAKQLPFKATAGLHHPLCGEYRLTYEGGSPHAPMYGFLNLAVATLVALGGGPLDRIVAALLEDDPTAIGAEGNGLRWRDEVFAAASIAGLRRSFHGFGSCSFREPIEELEPVPFR